MYKLSKLFKYAKYNEFENNLEDFRVIFNKNHSLCLSLYTALPFKILVFAFIQMEDQKSLHNFSFSKFKIFIVLKNLHGLWRM